MSILKFYAKADFLVSDPDYQRTTGSLPRYVGREYHPETRAYRASAEPTCYQAGSNGAIRLLKIIRNQNPIPLFPADAETAKACGLQFVKLELNDGEWVPAAKTSL